MFDFNLDDIEDVSFDLLPKGTYPVQVESAEVKDTKDGEGKYISLELTILGEKNEGRKLFDIINVVNKSEKAEKIGKSNLKKLILASGADIQTFTDADQLIGLECLAVVSVQSSKEYDDRNVIKKYVADTSDAEAEEEPTQHTPEGADSGEVFD
ncbi:MAG: DUF669 domain-containing protein [Candidatus Hodarchaeales archaeon]